MFKKLVSDCLIFFVISPVLPLFLSQMKCVGILRKGEVVHTAGWAGKMLARK